MAVVPLMLPSLQGTSSASLQRSSNAEAYPRLHDIRLYTLLTLSADGTTADRFDQEPTAYLAPRTYCGLATYRSELVQPLFPCRAASHSGLGSH